MKILTTFFVCMLLTCFCNPSFAKIWRVNNGGASADFLDIPSAITAASAGDTIQVEGSTTAYGGFTCSKKLIFIGPGYKLANNPKTQFNTSSATVSGGSFYAITFAPGSAGSVFEGFSFIEQISIQDNNITIRRNYGNGYGVYIGDGTSNTYTNDIIEQNYFVSIAYSSSTNTKYTNLQINNNIILSVNLPATNTDVTGTFYNNIVNQAPTIANFLIQNNIIHGDTTGNASTNIYTNNIFYNNTNTSTNGNGNFYVSDFTIIFADWTDLYNGNTTTDGDAVLASGSKAKGAGVGGVDMGVFSGADTYVLSGMPNVPSIYQLSVPNTINSSPMPVTISIKSHN